MRRLVIGIGRGPVHPPHREEIMRKLTLDLSSLVVQSFSTESLDATALGTVRGRQKESTETQGLDCSELVPCSLEYGGCESDECRGTKDASCSSAPKLDTNAQCTAVLPACPSLLDHCTSGGCSVP
jgi:hypothetical protein